MKKLIYLNLILTLLMVSMYTNRSFVALGGELSEIEASWYGFESCVHQDCLMANGTKFDETKISCASRQHYGKILTIEYQGKTIQCPVTDKISKTYDSTRIDISKAGFAELESLDKGLITIVLK